MLDAIKKLLKKDKPAVVKVKPPVEKKKRTTKPKQKKEETKPEVKVVNVGFDPKNPRVGDLELEWNSEFIKLLTTHGYQGNTEEDIVDAWLNDICRTIISNNPNDLGIPNMEGNNRYITRTELGDGRSEIK